jgi:hypothetical protein
MEEFQEGVGLVESPLFEEAEEETPEPTQRRLALVSKLQAQVKSAKKFHDTAFKGMKSDMQAVYLGYSDTGWNEDMYVANLLQRHVHQRTAALYAKNPKPVASRRTRMDYQIWDEDPVTLAKAYSEVKAAEANNVPPGPQAAQLVQEYETVQKSRKDLDKVSKSLELLFDYYMNEQRPTFKSQMKALVRRIITTSVGFVKVGYQRDVDRMPEVSAKMSDIQAQVDHIRRLTTEAEKGDITEDSAEMEELLLSLQSLEEEPLVTVQEGLLFDFPECDSIIVDPMCRQLRGFVGATWVAHEMYLSPEEINEIYAVDIEKDYLQYDLKGRASSGKDHYDMIFQNNEGKTAEEMREGLALVWEIYDKTAGLMYVICDGHKDFLQEPAAPPIRLETFWPIFSITFNEIEHKDQLYPPSDIRLLKPMQAEYNRARQGLREHRRANRPKYVAPAGMLEDEDKAKLRNPAANSLIELNALTSGQKVDDVIQPIRQTGIDPNLYEVKTIFDDVQLVVGQQEATWGQISKGTATETSIAESSRMSAIGANIDDLDSFMSEITRAAGQVLLLEMSPEEVKKIVGPGATWPEFLREDILNEIYLEIEAGSTGKPNKSAELQNIERIIPFLIQIPGIDPTFLARELLKRLDDKMDVDAAIAQNIPSIVAQNMAQGGAANVQRGGGSPESQGGKGGNNAPAPKVAGRRLGPPK